MLSFFKSGEGSSKEANKKNWVILIGAALGIALLLFGTNFEKNETVTDQKSYALEDDELILYQEHLEARVKELCESVGGVGNTTVIVTLGGSFESVYAIEDHDGGEKYVIIGSGSNAQALFLTRTPPTIAGIGIVCQGGDNANVRQELTELVSAAFHVSSNRIHVTSAKK